jgi:hypothetical protein
VISAKSHRLDSSGDYFIHASFDLFQSLWNVEGVAGNVTRVDNLGDPERFRTLSWIVWPQQSGRLADMTRSKSGARSITGSRIEWHTDNRDVCFRNLIDSGQPSKGWCPGKPGHYRCVNLSYYFWPRFNTRQSLS